MHRALEIGGIRLERKLLILKRWLDEESRRRDASAGELKRIGVWRAGIIGILDGIGMIKRVVKPLLERDLGVRLRRTEHLFIALFQPSTKNLFMELKLYAERREGAPLKAEEIGSLADLPEMARTFAWIGDAALNLAVLSELWADGRGRVGELTERRKSYVQNTNLAQLADRWRLFEHRIHLEPVQGSSSTGSESVVRIKGSLTESVVGVLYLQGGLNAISRVLPLIRPS